VAGITRRTVAAPAVGLVGAATLGACGPTGGGGAAAPSGLPQAGEVVRLTYLNSSADTAPVFQRIVDVFNERHPQIQAELTVAQGGPFFEKLQAMIAGGTPPDGAHLNNVQLPVLAGAGMLQDLGAYVKRYKTDLEDVFPPLRAHGEYKGVRYGLARSGGIQGLYYNLTAVKEAGLPTPNELDARGQWTWDAFLDLARRLTTRGAEGETARLGTARGLWEMWLYNGGGDLIEASGTKTLLDSPDAAAGFQFMADLVSRHRVAPTDAENAQQNEAARFLAGRLGMIFGVRGFIVTQLTRVTGFQPELVAVPRGKARVTFGQSVQSAVPAGTRHPEPAYRFVDWFTSTEALKISIVQSKDSVMPARRSLLDSAEFLTYSVPEVTSPNINKLWADELKAGRVKVHPAHPRLGEVVAAVSDEQPALVAGERTARDAMARLVPVVNAILQAR
jgi:multiple sugar transport system substrate-binding protein